MRCPNCGADNKEGTVHCSLCLTSLVQADKETTNLVVEADSFSSQDGNPTGQSEKKTSKAFVAIVLVALTLLTILINIDPETTAMVSTAIWTRLETFRTITVIHIFIGLILLVVVVFTRERAAVIKQDATVSGFQGLQGAGIASTGLAPINWLFVMKKTGLGVLAGLAGLVPAFLFLSELIRGGGVTIDVVFGLIDVIVIWLLAPVLLAVVIPGEKKNEIRVVSALVFSAAVIVYTMLFGRLLLLGVVEGSVRTINVTVLLLFMLLMVGPLIGAIRGFVKGEGMLYLALLGLLGELVPWLFLAVGPRLDLTPNSFAYQIHPSWMDFDDLRVLAGIVLAWSIVQYGLIWFSIALGEERLKGAKTRAERLDCQRLAD